MENSTENKEFYVYALSDPRTGKPFYIGKGKNKRMMQHEKNAVSGSKHPKCKLINEIKSAGLTVGYTKLKRFANEQEAYSYEAKVIKSIGRESLTNLTDGGAGAPSWVASQDTKDQESFESMICAIVKYEEMKQQGFNKFYILGVELKNFVNLINTYKAKLYNYYLLNGDKCFNAIIKSCRKKHGLSISLRFA